ncbi:macrolide transport system ATP-binding/permease protein [Nocardia amikacinitolerans]|uniref:ABC-F family ATP-binding cassette domain-containing protein n=1 Tax=Nocardia amikacinitolerans TaxID=756689 RepID=UPI0009FE640F|nr:ABC-F family ATP-binding cassette domain-containing protein [Nocardia amikacinitolerans]MCP2315153.1 macrolide transport system ATP-binding/permease protein [Nocardia amikacinitolerans]
MEFHLTTQLTLRGVAKSYGDRRVLDGVTLTIRPGERVGIVGENGSGKSTLLRLMIGAERADDGVVTVDAPGGIGYLGQTLAGETVADAIDLALAELRDLERRMREAAAAQDMDAYGELLTAFEARDGYDADARVDKAMHGLGLAGIGRDRAVASLSGGEQARLGLACLLAASPEILLLDEPTNHLDESALTWLEDRLRAHRGTVVVVSHDRVFLDRVVTAIIEVEHGGVTRFGGGYTGFLAEKAAARQRWEQAYAQWRDEIRRLEEFSATTAHRVAAGRVMKDNNKMAYDRNAGRVQSSISSRVRQTAERLRRLTDDPVPAPPKPLRFRGRFGAAQAKSFEIGQLTLGPRDRLLIDGPNGSGKSTLLDAIYARTPGRVGYLRQEVAFDPTQTVAQAYGHGRDALVATGLFHRSALDVPVGALSEGQRRRLALAGVLAGEHDLLLLDEPTNHLSLALVEDLEQALGEYPGAVVVVSHDRALRRRFRGERKGVHEFA